MRDLAFAKGRFLLMALVVVLIAFLTTLLSGLSAGLIKNNISGLMHAAVHAHRVRVQRRAQLSGDAGGPFHVGGLGAGAGGRAGLEPLGHTVFNARGADNEPLELVLWGMRPGHFSSRG